MRIFKLLLEKNNEIDGFTLLYDPGFRAEPNSRAVYFLTAKEPELELLSRTFRMHNFLFSQIQ